MSLPLAAHYDRPRRHPRVAIDLVARLDQGTGPERVVVGDLSSGGLFCATEARPRVGTPVTLYFRLLAQLECKAVGRVVWHGDSRGRRGFGVEFEDTSKQMASFTSNLARMATHLRPIYLAGVIGPTITLG